MINNSLSPVERAYVDTPAHVPVTEQWQVSAGCHRPRWPGAECCVLRSASLHQPGWGRTAPRSAVSASHSITELLPLVAAKMFVT